MGRASGKVQVRAAEGLDSRRHILDSAARLFREKGYAAVSLRDIADAAGINNQA